MRNSNRFATIANEFNAKTEKYRNNTTEVDQATNNEQNSFEEAKKLAQKNYDATLSKGLSVIKNKLENDLKNI